MAAWVYSGFERWAGVCLPAHCVLCRGPGGAPGVDLCAACESELPRLGQACGRCGLPSAIPDGPSGGLCPRCTTHPPAYARCVAACRYEFPLTQLIPALKYQGALANARVLGRLLATAVAGTPGGRDVDCAIPMPLHASRLVERGFNQSHEIARFVAAPLGIALEPSALRRTRLTAPQVGLSREQRLANVRGAFSADPRRVRGLRVALLDDVVTTSSTAAAAAGSLLDAGASRVDLWCVARAPG